MIQLRSSLMTKIWTIMKVHQICGLQPTFETCPNCSRHTRVYALPSLRLSLQLQHTRIRICLYSHTRHTFPYTPKHPQLPHTLELLQIELHNTMTATLRDSHVLCLSHTAAPCIATPTYSKFHSPQLPHSKTPTHCVLQTLQHPDNATSTNCNTHTLRPTYYDCQFCNCQTLQPAQSTTSTVCNSYTTTLAHESFMMWELSLLVVCFHHLSYFLPLVVISRKRGKELNFFCTFLLVLVREE